MADGAPTGVEEAHIASEHSKPRPVAGFLSWLFRTRRGRLTIWIVLACSLLVGAITWHYTRGPLFPAASAQSWLVIAIAGIALPLLLLMLDPPDNLTIGPKVYLPAWSLLLLTLVAALVISDRVFDWHLLSASGGAALFGRADLNLIAVFTYIFVALAPSLWNSINFGRHNAARAIERSGNALTPTSEEKDAEAMGALLATFVVIAIGGLAYLAGRNGGDVSFKNSLGLILCAAVIGVFAIVVFLDVISESAPVQALSSFLQMLSKKMRWLAGFYNWVDTGLVRLGAGVSGMEHRSMKSRYIILIGVLGSLSLLGWFLPPPYGLLPVTLGFILAISISRLWSWVEEDRALAAMTDFRRNAPYRVGFREDYRDETLLGFIFVFAMVPIAMMQAHEGKVFGDHLFAHADHKDFLEWFGYFGVELAKAVPIVDWAEIYGVQPNADMISMSGVASKHSVFLARVMVDLVLIASLLQAIGITNRNRQQKRLFSAGHIDRLDYFVEQNELAKAVRVTRLRGNGAYRDELIPSEAINLFDLNKLNNGQLIDFRRYNQDQLRAIHSKTNDSKIRTLIAAISHEGGWTLSHAIDHAKDIANSHKNEMELFKAFERAKAEHEDHPDRMDAGDIYTLLSALRSTSGLRDFKEQLIAWLVKLGSPETSMDYLLGLAAGDKADGFKYTRNHAAKRIEELAGKIDRIEPIREAYSKLSNARINDNGPSQNPLARVLRVLKERLNDL